MTVTSQHIIDILISGALFIVLWQVLGLLVFRPFFRNYEEREARTSGDEVLSVEKRQQARTLRIQLEDQLRAARLEGIRARDEQVLRAKQEGQAVIDRANAQAAEELRKVAENIAELKRIARSEMPQEVDKLAQLVVSRALTTDATRMVH